MIYIRKKILKMTETFRKELKIVYEEIEVSKKKIIIII